MENNSIAATQLEGRSEAVFRPDSEEKPAS